MSTEDINAQLKNIYSLISKPMDPENQKNLTKEIETFMMMANGKIGANARKSEPELKLQPNVVSGYLFFAVENRSISGIWERNQKIKIRSKGRESYGKNKWETVRSHQERAQHNPHNHYLLRRKKRESPYLLGKKTKQKRLINQFSKQFKIKPPRLLTLKKKPLLPQNTRQ